MTDANKQKIVKLSKNLTPYVIVVGVIAAILIIKKISAK